MKWNFTPEDILSGKAYYSVAQFKKDLFEEVRNGIDESTRNDEFIKLYFTITVMTCISLAFGKSMDSFCNTVKNTITNNKVQKMMTDKKFLNGIKQSNLENIEMFKAVVRKRIRDDIAIGIDRDCITNTITDEMMQY